MSELQQPARPEDRIFLTIDFNSGIDRIRFLAQDFKHKVHAVKLSEGYFLYPAAHALQKFLISSGVVTYHDAKYGSQADQMAEVIERESELGFNYVSVAANAEPKSLIAAAQAKKSLHIVAALQYGSRALDRIVSVNNNLDATEQIDAVMCNVKDINRVKAAGIAAVIAVGLRMPGDSQYDQPAVATPAEALREGADYLAIGRSITAYRYEEQFQAYERILENIASAG